MSFEFDCRRCGRQGSVPDEAVTPHEDDGENDAVKVVLPPGWFAVDDHEGMVCLDCVEPDVLRAWVAEQIELQALERMWHGPTAQPR